MRMCMQIDRHQTQGAKLCTRQCVHARALAYTHTHTHTHTHTQVRPGANETGTTLSKNAGSALGANDGGLVQVEGAVVTGNGECGVSAQVCGCVGGCGGGCGCGCGWVWMCVCGGGGAGWCSCIIFVYINTYIHTHTYMHTCINA
jgi:hypothetical protein